MTGLTALLLMLAHITVTMTSESGDWVLVFKGVTGGSTSIYDLFLGNTSYNAYVKEAQVLDNSFPDHYKSDIINYWDDMDITKVKVGVYVGHEERTFFEFDARGCNISNWFDRSKLINSSYTDLLLTSTPVNYFSMEGHKGQTGEDHHVRRFFVNSHYDGCPNDRGWFFVYDVGSRGICLWEKDHLSEVPAVLFVSGSTSAMFMSERGKLRADFMTISVQFGSNSSWSQCSLPESEDSLDTKTTTTETITTTPVDEDTLNKKVETIKKELAVIKKSTSAYIRTKTSAPDSRQSSKGIGVIGVSVIIAVLLLVVVPDLLALVRHVSKLGRRRVHAKTNPNRVVDIDVQSMAMSS
ncbi:uncharacterized protein [Argopecten irradians]|uniref:uncharacterized protein n=1 Tax=Argopecten irradians TaxID=31199 RepID=UPI00371267C5